MDSPRSARYDEAGAPTLTALEVDPAQRSVRRNMQQQLGARATYSDGSTRDVTSLALYETNDRAMAEVSGQGMVKVLDIAGNASVMVRYQGQVAVFSISIPLEAPITNLPVAHHFVDEHVFANLKAIGVQPSPVCDDATFLRRVTLILPVGCRRKRKPRRFSPRTTKRNAIARSTRCWPVPIMPTSSPANGPRC